VKELFDTYQEFPDGTTMEDRSELIFNGKELSAAIHDYVGETFSDRQVIKTMTDAGFTYKSYKIGKKNKKGFILKRKEKSETDS
jgi:hypothetical protein